MNPTKNGQGKPEDLPNLDAFASANPSFSVRRLRHIEQSARFGVPEYVKFAPAFVRVGRRIHVDPAEFFKAAKGGAA